MIEILLILFGIACMCAYWTGEENNAWVNVYLLLGFLLAMVAGFRPLGIDQDSMAYYNLFLHPDVDETEPSFYYISLWTNRLWGQVRPIFVIYALLGVGLKLYAITRLTKLWFLAILIYLSNFFIMHEMTQIRAGVAAGLFLYALHFLANGDKKKYLLTIGVAVLFHYSSLVLLPLVFLNNKPIGPRSRWIWGALIPLSYVFYFAKFTILLQLPIPYVQDKIDVYEKLMEAGIMGDTVNSLNLVFLAKLLVFYLILLKYDVIAEQSPNLNILLKIFTISCFCFNFFSFFPVLSFRISELFGTVEIVLFPLLYYAIKPRWVAVSVVAAIAVTVMFINVYYNELLAVKG